MVSPSGYPAQIGLILDHKNESVKFARPGENVQVTLIHIVEENMIQKGDILTNRENPCPVTMIFEAEIEIMELLEHKMIISKGYSCIMHCHTFADDITIKDLLSVEEINLASGAVETKDTPKFIKSFCKARVRISTRIPIAIEKFDVLP
jgi:peptide chain release factor subunit 3